MTTRALIANHRWSNERARAGMIDLAVAAETSWSGRRVRVIPEPLVRAADGGGRLRALRLEIAGLGSDLTLSASDVDVLAGSGARLPLQEVPGPPGSLRLLIPASDVDETISVAIPVLGSPAPLSVVLPPVRDWTIHLVHHSHLDIGYTDPQGTVLGEHIAFLDSCLDLVRQTADWPADARFRWAVESLWSFEQWERARPKERVEEFLSYVRDGRIELTAMPYNLHTDTCSTDELHELLRLARGVRDRYGIEFTSAMQTDVPGTVAGLPDALAQLGVRYLSVAHNWAGRSVPHLVGGQRLPRLFRWRSPAGQSVLVWMTDSPHGLAYMEGPVLGFDTSYADVDDLLPAYLTSLSTQGYPFPPGMFGWHGPAVEGREPYPWDVLHLRVQGHFGDNAPPRLIMADTVRRWNDTWLFPHLRMSRNEDFFVDAESRLGDAIQTFEGDWGDWWVEGVGSGARPLAMTRHAQELLPQAQTMSAMAQVLGSAPVPDEAAQSAAVYGSISLFNEHTWGAADPWTDGDSGMDSGEQQWHWKYAHGLRAADDADTFAAHAAAQLGSILPGAPDALVTAYAVNTTAWARSETVSVFVRESRVPLDVPLLVRDGRSGAELPVDERAQTNSTHRDAGRFLEVHVPEVPALGIVRLDIVAGSRSEIGDSPDDPLVLENEHLRVCIDLARACIGSIVERVSGRELVNPDATVGFNAYVYDTYTTAGGFNHQSNKTSVTEELELLGSRSLGHPAAFLAKEVTATGQRVRYEFAADGVRWVRVTVSLDRAARVVRIENRMSKPATMTKESAFFAFPFAVDDPTVRYEITGALTGDGLEHVPGAPQHMRAVRNWVTFAGADHAVAWATREAPLVHPQTIALPYAPFPDSTSPREPGTLYSWVHNNIWDTNFPSQQGFEASFCYAIGVDDGCSSEALGIRTAGALTSPLIGVVSTAPARSDAAAETSLLAVDDDRVQIISMSGVDDGVLVRLQSFADAPISATLRATFPFRAAQAASYLGDSLGSISAADGAVAVALPRLGTAAVLLSL